MKSRLPRFREWWKNIFFWRHPKQHSQEFKPAPHADHALVLSVTESTLAPAWKQLRFISYLLSPKERRLLWGALALFVVSVLIGMGDLARPHLERVPTVGGTLTEAVIGSPKLINPLLAPSNDVDRDLTALIYAGLFRLGDDLEPQPDLVENYRWLDNQKTLEVSLRKDARFHDGTPVTADDVVFTYQAVKNANWQSSASSQFHDLDKVIRVDDQTLQFQFTAPDPDILSNLTLGILPAHVWEDVPDTNTRLAEANLRPIGSGPYMVASFTRDGKGTILSYTLKRFAQYHGEKPFINEWTFRFYADQTQALGALRNHQVDALAFIPWGDMAQVKNSDVKQIHLELPQETVAFFNVKDALLKDIQIRKALSLVIDKKELQEIVGSQAQIVDSPFPFLEVGTSTTADLETARKILDGAGWKLKEGDTVRALTPKKTRTASATTSSTPLALTIDVPDQPDLVKVAEYLKRRWSLLGAHVTIHASDAEPLLREALEKRDYQIVVWNILLSPTQDISPFWNSKNTTQHGLNLSNLSDRTIDTALTALANATSSEAITQNRVQVSRAILNQYPALFLLRPTAAYVLSNRVQGVNNQRISRPEDRLLESAHWYLKTTWRWK